MKTENAELRTLLNELEQRIAALEPPKDDLPDCYVGFIEQELAEDDYYLYYLYELNEIDEVFDFYVKSINNENKESGFDTNYLLIFVDNENKMHYVRYELDAQRPIVYIDEAYGNTEPARKTTRGYAYYNDLNIPLTTGDEHKSYIKKYSKP